MEIKEKFKLIGEGKSKKIYTDGESIYLEFKGDVHCSTYSVKYDKRIAELRAKTSVSLFNILRERMEGIPKVELIKQNIIKMKQAKPLPLEWIPRFVAAGSVVKRFGFKKGYSFKDIVLKIDYKGNEDDYLINDDLIIEKGILSLSKLNEAKNLSKEVARILRNIFLDRGLILWDFKLELGLDDKDNIILIDEISLDGMRLKDSDTGESLDKDVFRETGNIERVILAYEKAYERIFGGEMHEKYGN